MKYHCFFEQSGTFKNEFKKLGYEAYDYDIKNDFNETDFIIDLFKEIENAYENKKSIFDNLVTYAQTLPIKKVATGEFQADMKVEIMWTQI